MKIVNLGSLNVDHVYRVDRFLLPGETKASKGLNDNAGGKGLNQSIAAARTGAEVYHAGYFGAGSEMLREVLQNAGVHMDWMEDHMDIPCGHTMIQVDDQGQNCILLFGGTNMCLTEAYIDRVLDQCTPDDILLLQNETNLIPYIIEAAARRGIPVAMNAAPMDEGVKAYPIGKLRYLIVNEIEGAALAGMLKYPFLTLCDAAAFAMRMSPFGSAMWALSQCALLVRLLSWFPGGKWVRLAAAGAVFALTFTLPWEPKAQLVLQISGAVLAYLPILWCMLHKRLTGESYI